MIFYCHPLVVIHLKNNFSVCSFTHVSATRTCKFFITIMFISFFSSQQDRKSTRLNSSHSQISYAVFCLKKKKRFNVISAPTALSFSSSLINISDYLKCVTSSVRFPYITTTHFCYSAASSFVSCACREH